MKVFLFLLAGVAIIVLAFVGGILGRGCKTANEMADQTVFNADKHVWSYEEFHRKYNQYEQYRVQMQDAKEVMDELEKKGMTENQRYGNLSMEYDGVRNMMKRIAAEYNTMSEIGYQKIWKSKGLPGRLD